MRLMIDGRMESDRFGPGDGVYTYYRMLRRIGSTFPAFSVLNDRLTQGIAVEHLPTRVMRAVRAVAQRTLTVDPEHPPHDIFRLAHVRFKLTGHLTGIDLAGPPGVFHWTYPLPLWARGWRNIYTVHDALQLGPGGLQGRALERQVALLMAIRTKAHRLVTVSDYSRGELSNRLGWPLDEITNASIAVFPPLATPKADVRRDGPILVLGTNGERKNIEFLLEAYRKSAIARPLVIVGPLNAYAADLAARYASLSGVTFTGPLSEQEISVLLGKARCLAFPSRSEGFGLPIVEAMVHGCPVICANSGAMAEVAGHAAITFTLGNLDELTAILRQTDCDDNLMSRHQKAGEERARDFNETNMRKRLSVLYEV